MPDTPAKPDSDFMLEVRKRFDAADDGWRDVRKEALTDLKFATGDQWKPEVKQAREDSDMPALSFNRLAPLIQAITNRARQQRPQPKINPKTADANEQTAEVLEGIMRHIHYVSQADVAYDCAIEYSAACGLGYYEITTEYVDDDSFDQEPRIRRILDPMTVYFDPAAMEPDFSDAKYCFVRTLISNEAYEDRFGKQEKDSITPFPNSDNADKDWYEHEHTWVARYFEVTETKRKKVALTGDRKGYADELGDYKPEEVLNEREVTDRKVDYYVVDGHRVLEHHEWAGKWIPIVPVLGGEKVVDGKRQFVSAVRYVRDAQKLFNATKSKMAQIVGTANNSEYVGYKGSFKDKKWLDNAPQKYLEIEPVMINGQLAPPPQKNVSEPPIQALSMFAMQEGDDIKAGIGYIDNLLAPSRNDLSGVAVQRRTQQSDLVNYHLQDNLERSQWHCARILLDLISKVIDTPRVLKIMGYDGTVSEALVTTRATGGRPVPGHENDDHHYLDNAAANYSIVVTSQPSYASKLEEEKDVLIQTIQANPQLFPMYADIYFKLLGFPELEERAQTMLPPQIQQAEQAKAQGMPPAAAAQIQQLTAQNQQLQQGMQQVLQILTSKQLETQGKIEVEKAKATRELAVEAMKAHHQTNMAMHDAAHEHNQAILDAHMAAIQRITEMLHESEMAPPQQPAGAIPQGNGAGAPRRPRLPAAVLPGQVNPQQRPF
jgi:hypothetical protein